MKEKHVASVTEEAVRVRRGTAELRCTIPRG